MFVNVALTKLARWVKATGKPNSFYSKHELNLKHKTAEFSTMTTSPT
jgi:hypothetical protein